MLRKLLLLSIIASFSCPVVSQTRGQKAVLWRGDAFLEKEGGLAINLIPTKFLARERADAATLVMLNLESNQQIIFDFNLTKDLARAVKVWKLAAGQYQITKLLVATAKGIYEYNGPHQKVIVVDAQKFNNVGKWYVIEQQGRKLALVEKSSRKKVPARSSKTTAKTGIVPPRLPSQQVKQAKPNPPETANISKVPLLPSRRAAKEPQTKGAEVSARKKKVAVKRPVREKPRRRKPVGARPPKRNQTPEFQARKLKANVNRSGKSRQKILRKLPSSGVTTDKRLQEIRAEYTYQQTVSMYYQIDLGRYNRNSARMKQVIAKHDPKLRQCYVDRLESNESLRGMIAYKFLYSKMEKSFRSLKMIKQSVNDPRLIECVYWEIAGLSFPFKIDMIGSLTFTFDTK